MIAISTKYVAATSTRSEGIRVSAAGAKAVFFAWQHGMSGKDNHQWAALQLATDLNYDGQFFRMENPAASEGWLYVCVGNPDGSTDIPAYYFRDGFKIGRALTAAEHLSA